METNQTAQPSQSVPSGKRAQTAATAEAVETAASAQAAQAAQAAPFPLRALEPVRARLLELFRLDFVRNNRLDTTALLASRQKDIELLAGANVAVLGGLQDVVRQQADFLTATAGELQSLSRRDAANDADAVSVRATEVLPRCLRNAVESLRGIADTVYTTQADVLCAAGRRVAENVEEAKGLLRPKP